MSESKKYEELTTMMRGIDPASGSDPGTRARCWSCEAGCPLPNGWRNNRPPAWRA